MESWSIIGCLCFNEYWSVHRVSNRSLTNQNWTSCGCYNCRSFDINADIMLWYLSQMINHLPSRSAATTNIVFAGCTCSESRFTRSWYATLPAHARIVQWCRAAPLRNDILNITGMLFARQLHNRYVAHASLLRYFQENIKPFYNDV